MNEQELIENPEALLNLTQQAIQQLVELRPNTIGQEAQLRAVAKAIEQLEKQRVPVPDSLRKTKMMLVDQIGQYAEFNCRLKDLGKGLVEMLEMIESALGQPLIEDKPDRKTTHLLHHHGVRDQPKTPSNVLRECILQALSELDGSAQCNDVLNRINLMLKDKFTPGDMEPHGNSGPTWRNRVQWERLRMVKEGILRDDSKFGYWELAEKQL